LHHISRVTSRQSILLLGLRRLRLAKKQLRILFWHRRMLFHYPVNLRRLLKPYGQRYLNVAVSILHLLR
jgi:hypothetical protein